MRIRSRSFKRVNRFANASAQLPPFFGGIGRADESSKITLPKAGLCFLCRFRKYRVLCKRAVQVVAGQLNLRQIKSVGQVSGKSNGGLIIKTARIRFTFLFREV